jgi:cytochrome c553
MTSQLRSLILILFGLLSVPLTLWAEAEGPKSIVFQTKLGSVTFLHDNHQERLSNDCVKCHHVKGEKKKQACRNCHKRKLETVVGDPLSFYDVKMELCRGCHREKRAANKASKAPVFCKDCHNVKEIRYPN